MNKQTIETFLRDVQDVRRLLLHNIATQGQDAVAVKQADDILWGLEQDLEREYREYEI